MTKNGRVGSVTVALTDFSSSSLPPLPRSVIHKTRERIIGNDLVSSFICFMNPLLYCGWIGTPVVDFGKSRLDVVAESRRNRILAVLGCILAGVCWQNDAEQPRPRIVLCMPNTCPNFPIDMFSLPCFWADKNHGYG